MTPIDPRSAQATPRAPRRGRAATDADAPTPALDERFWRGLAVAVPLMLVLWALLAALAVVAWRAGQ